MWDLEIQKMCLEILPDFNFVASGGICVSHTHVSMLITLPRGYEKCPFGFLLSSIHIMYFHIHGIRSRVEQGAP